MIDIEKLKAAALANVTDPDAVIELIERLEKAENDAADYKAQLSESQAEIARLRKSIDYIGSLNSAEKLSIEITRVCRYELAAPSDATALNELIDKAGEVMRERCLFEIDPKNYTNDFAQGVVYGCCDEIRALPGVTLEDLK